MKRLRVLGRDPGYQIRTVGFIAVKGDSGTEDNISRNTVRVLFLFTDANTAREALPICHSSTVCHMWQ